ncbi:MAG: class I SAM-dependent methyltransferase [Saprospiraceae bacterium]|jgi:ubiquinone/menaquinone biosynthesis C-methylase UbiE|nr:class I SAM-dependent methyltransferase [Saprospiraceae bacterium]
MKNAQRPTPAEYQPFPNVERRNFAQEFLEVPLMIKALGLPKQGSILEVGCGRGIALPPIDKMCCPSRLVGLDIDEGLTALARQRAAARGLKCEIVTGDVRALPFDDASFDLVIDFGTCYHIAKADVALHEIARVLKPGGIFVHETTLSQLLSHPILSFGKKIPWEEAPALVRGKSAWLWAIRQKQGSC